MERRLLEMGNHFLDLTVGGDIYAIAGDVLHLEIAAGAVGTLNWRSMQLRMQNWLDNGSQTEIY